MFASVPMLAFGIKTYDFEIMKLIILTVISLYSGFFAALIWNDITDADIDAVAHPDRPIPSGRISSQKFFAVALLFSALTFIFSFLVSFWCFLLVIFAALFVTFHNKYLKKKIKIPAYSEIFTPMQWVVVGIFGYLAIWTVIPQHTDFVISLPYLGSISANIYEIQNMLLLAVFIYFADNAHDLPEGIHDAVGDRKLGVKTYATSFGEKNAARISFTMFFISGLLGFLLFYRTTLTYVFLVPFICIWIYTLYHSYKLLKMENLDEMRRYGWTVGRKGFNYLLFIFDLIFIDLLIQLVFFNF
jgi:geranylgeranylglycerol-phosphate geranylgeranyltransferase